MNEPELLDGPVHDPRELAESLRMVEQVNRWLAGHRSLRNALAPYLESGVARTLLDVGTGGGDTARGIRDWARHQGSPWSVVGLDLHPQTARLARAAGSPGAQLPVVRGDARALPFADRAFDIAFSSLTLHHFDDEEAVDVLREMARVSRRGVVVSDLERSALGLAGARVLASTAWRRNRITRNDGPLSVRRSFTRGELMNAGRRAGLGSVRVLRYFPSRLLLVGATSEVGG